MWWAAPVFKVTLTDYQATLDRLYELNQAEKSGTFRDHRFRRILNEDLKWYRNKLEDICIKHVSIDSITQILNSNDHSKH